MCRGQARAGSNNSMIILSSLLLLVYLYNNNLVTKVDWKKSFLLELEGPSSFFFFLPLLERVQSWILIDKIQVNPLICWPFVTVHSTSSLCYSAFRHTHSNEQCQGLVRENFICFHREIQTNKLNFDYWCLNFSIHRNRWVKILSGACLGTDSRILSAYYKVGG